jgi:hypothetical protein
MYSVMEHAIKRQLQPFYHDRSLSLSKLFLSYSNSMPLRSDESDDMTLILHQYFILDKRKGDAISISNRRNIACRKLCKLF